MEKVKSSPKITIITITYNSEKTVCDTLESVRRQHYPNLEYLIVDGGSKDRTLNICDEYRDVVSSIVSEPDNGISDAMNKGIRRATGDLIGIIHSDDMLEDGALAALADAWDGISDIYYGHSVIINESGKAQNILLAEKDLHGMEYGFRMVHPSTFVAANAYKKYGVFDTKYKCAMDYELMLRMYKAGAKFRYMDRILAKYRMGGTNMRLRKLTINEVRDVSIAHGGSRVLANYYAVRKKLLDCIRPVLTCLHIHNRRVEKI